MVSRRILLLIALILSNIVAGFIETAVKFRVVANGKRGDPIQGLLLALGSTEQTNDDGRFPSEPAEDYSGFNAPNFPSLPKIPRSKDFLYDNEELENLLALHLSLKTQPKFRQAEDKPELLIPSLHDLVLEATRDVNLSNGRGATSLPSLASTVSDELRQRLSQISAIASDVDGTLLTSSQNIHPRTKIALRMAVEAKEITWFPATGKTKWGALNSLGTEIAALVSKCPGVFVQGLYCVDSNDNVIFERKLPKAAVEATEIVARKFNASIVAYDGDYLYSTALTQCVIDLHEIWGEPLATQLPASIASDHESGVHKILVMDDDLEKIARIRPALEVMAQDCGCNITQAIPTMLEVIPAGCSKGLGVKKLCEFLGIDPNTELMGIGDAENDVDMLKIAAVGVAVGNACDIAKAAADIVLTESNDEGGAGVAMEAVLDRLY